jgi:hypothetical protein
MTNPELESLVVVDVDGTIALRNGREPFEWHKVSTDLPFRAVVDLINDLVSLGQKIMFVSGRDEGIRNETEIFIQRHINGNHALHMRQSGDFRADEVVKLEIYNREILDKYTVRFVLDDRDRVVNLWRNKLGLPTFQVNNGDF